MVVGQTPFCLHILTLNIYYVGMRHFPNVVPIDLLKRRSTWM